MWSSAWKLCHVFYSFSWGLSSPFYISLFDIESLDSPILVAKVSSQAFIDRFLVGTEFKSNLWSMQPINALSHSRHLEQHAIELRTFIIVGILNLIRVVRHDTTTGLLLVGKSCACITIRINWHIILGWEYFYLNCSFISIIFSLNSGHEFTPLFVEQLDDFHMYVPPTHLPPDPSHSLPTFQLHVPSSSHTPSVETASGDNSPPNSPAHSFCLRQ